MKKALKEEVYEEMNNRPSDYNTHHDNKGDCTTRAMTFCLKDEMSYRQIEALQYQLAEDMHTHRNTNGTWDMIMIDRGWKWINLDKKIPRGEAAVLLRGASHPIISHSRGHVAVVNEGKVKDVWNSAGGRCQCFLVHPDDQNAVMNVFSAYGFMSKTADHCEFKIKHHGCRMF